MTDVTSLIGSRIGAFEVQALLGSGGMGEVYRAHDTRLGRYVALKIIRPVLAADTEHMLRFEREARILATLNHSNIAAIYGIEEVPASSGARARALVLELVHGETLAARISRVAARTGAGLPVPEALEIAAQIAAALDAAHEHGIVHRDLKPANVTITEDQVVKVLDFGLAMTVASSGAERSLTIPGATQEGLMLGTPAYMSPEQARGKPVDARADIWAFGCVLYELLSAKPAFARSTIADTIAAILGDEPDWAALPHPTPAHVRQLLRWCLTKDPRRRLRSIGDARLDTPVAILPPDSAAVTAPSYRDVQFQRLTDFPGVNESPAISPDGKMIAFVAMAGGVRQVWILLLSGGTPLQVTRDSVHHEHPRWAPDSGAIIYYTHPVGSDEEGTIWEMSALGGTSRPIASALGGGDVSHSGQRIALFRLRNGTHQLVTVARDGSDPRVVATIPGGSRGTLPRWSPDDRWIAGQTNSIDQFVEHLCVFGVDGGAPTVVASAGSLQGCCWLPDGSGLVYSSSAGSTLPYPRICNLRCVGRDGASDRQVTFGDTSQISPDVHRSGRLIACRVRAASDIWRFSVLGPPAENVQNAVRITNQTGQVQVPSVSPDGLEVAYVSDNGGHANLWVSLTDRSETRQLTFERDPSVSIGVPLWSPAGAHIAFIKAPQGGIEIWIVNRDGRGLRPLVPGGYAACWSPDGQWLYFCEASDAFAENISKIRIDGGAPILVRGGNVHGPVVGDSAFYFARRPDHVPGRIDWEICRAWPEDGPAEIIAHVAGARLPLSPLFVQGALSPDGKWIALPLGDGATTNIWAFPTAPGPMRQLTDLGGRPTLIARRVSWSPDSEAVYAAVAEVSADVVMYDGLL